MPLPFVYLDEHLISIDLNEVIKKSSATGPQKWGTSLSQIEGMKKNTCFFLLCRHRLYVACCASVCWDWKMDHCLLWYQICRSTQAGVPYGVQHCDTDAYVARYPNETRRLSEGTCVRTTRRASNIQNVRTNASALKFNLCVSVGQAHYACSACLSLLCVSLPWSRCVWIPLLDVVSCAQHDEIWLIYFLNSIQYKKLTSTHKQILLHHFN